VTPYTFERLNAFLVEDNGYVRQMLEDMLRQFRFGRVSTAANGQQAIECLKTVYASRMSGAFGTPDLVISDLVMKPINGLLLLRWVRTAKDSPNRFMPFVMLSGAADRDYVNAARDLGANEFLAKPFSAKSVYERIIEVVDYPRQFVATRAYFGPDRRRKAQPAGGEDRRRTREEDVTVVYAADSVKKPPRSARVWHFRLPNGLKDKVAGIGGAGGPGGAIPMDILEEAEASLGRAALDFAKWALDYLDKLSRLCQDALDDAARRSKHFGEINLLAHELRGQGGTFGYPLISVFGKMLYDVTFGKCRDDEQAVEVVKAHIDAMRAVLREKIAGDGGEVGRQLIKSLEAAVARITA
jgi:DNA-binding response OmpR family regulator